MDKVRVLRVIEYIGPRNLIEEQVKNSIHGEKTFGRKGEEVTIRVATLGTFPEILNDEPR